MAPATGDRRAVRLSLPHHRARGQRDDGHRRGRRMSEGKQAMRIGFVGLGAMGGRIAGRLLAAGHEVHGYNRTRAKAEGLVERGLIWRDSPREVAAVTDIVFSMVTDDGALAAIASGTDGILAGLAP